MSHWIPTSLATDDKRPTPANLKRLVSPDKVSQNHATVSVVLYPFLKWIFAHLKHKHAKHTDLHHSVYQIHIAPIQSDKISTVLRILSLFWTSFSFNFPTLDTLTASGTVCAKWYVEHSVDFVMTASSKKHIRMVVGVSQVQPLNLHKSVQWLPHV